MPILGQKGFSTPVSGRKKVIPGQKGILTPVSGRKMPIPGQKRLRPSNGRARGEPLGGVAPRSAQPPEGNIPAAVPSRTGITAEGREKELLA